MEEDKKQEMYRAIWRLVQQELDSPWKYSGAVEFLAQEFTERIECSIVEYQQQLDEMAGTRLIN